MNEKIFLEKTKRVLNECQKHILRLNEADEDLNVFMPLNKERYASLTKDEVQALDQFLFRFSKLQDVMGRKLFRLVLIFKEGDELAIEQMPFLDILNTLEKIAILHKDDWLRVRDIRNELAHNYDDEAEETAEILNKIYNQKNLLIKIFQNCKKYLERD